MLGGILAMRLLVLWGRDGRRLRASHFSTGWAAWLGFGPLLGYKGPGRAGGLGWPTKGVPSMKGHEKVIELLNDVLTMELTAINQYFIHAKMCQNWGFLYLADKVRHESIDEMRHAEALIDRILYLDGVPNLQRLNKINVGETVPEQFKCDHALEVVAMEKLNTGIAFCREVADNGSRELLEKILVSEEEHADWLETQLELIKQLGEAHYLSTQIRKD